MITTCHFRTKKFELDWKRVGHLLQEDTASPQVLVGVPATLFYLKSELSHAQNHCCKSP